MRKLPVPLRTTLRQPIRTLLFILLIALVSFAFTIQVFEGLIVNREIHRLAQGYQSFGTLMPTEDWEWDISEAREMLKGSPLVAYTETLRVIPGVMEDIYTPDIDGRSHYPNKMFVYGTLVDKTHFQELELRGRAGFFPEFTELVLPYFDVYSFEIRVDTVAAALPEHVSENDVMRFYFIDYRGEQRHVYEQAQIGGRYFVGGQYGIHLNLIRQMYSETFGPRAPLTPPTWLPISSYQDLLLLPLTQDGLYLYPVLEGTTMSEPEIMEMVEILQENLHTVFLRPTRDMNARMDVKNSMFLLEGRFIDTVDYENANPVAVIRAEFAQLRGLAIGDTLTMTMRVSEFATEHALPDARRNFPVPRAGIVYDRETFLNMVDEGILSGVGHITLSWIDAALYNQTHAGYIQDYFYNVLQSPFSDGILYDGVIYFDSRGIDEIVNLEISTGYLTTEDIGSNWQDADTKTVTFEIVGIYGTTDRLSNILTVSHNNVFVPDSVVPSQWLQEVPYRNFSFVLNSPAVEEEFILTYQRTLEEMGFWPLFTESGWNTFIAAVSPIRDGILTGILTFGLLTLIIFCIAILLYLAQRRQEFAITRALGTGKTKALWNISLPVVLKGLPSLGGGVISAWFFTLSRGNEILGGIEEAVFYPPPILWFFMVLASLFLLLLIFLSIGIFRLSSYSELELLQGNRSKKIKRKHGINKANKPAPLEEPESAGETKLNLSLLTQKTNLRQDGLGISYSLRMMRRHTLRKPIKSFLSIAIALGFMVVLSWIPFSIQENIKQINWFYENTVITATTVVDPTSGTSRAGSIPGRLLAAINDLTPYRKEVEEARTEYNEEGDEHFFIASYHGEVDPFMAITDIKGIYDIVDTEEESWYQDLWWKNVVGFSRRDLFETFHGVYLDITFADGYDMEIFEQPDPDEPVILVARREMSAHHLEWGEYLHLVTVENAWSMRARDFESYRIVGSFDVQGIGASYITPLVHLQNHIGRDLRYNRVEFELNPALNRELEDFRTQIDELMMRTDPQLIFILRDHILREVVEPLEQNIVMMETLYPIILVLSGFIAMGLTILLLLPTMKEAAIMRATGNSKLRVNFIFGMEQKVLCILGLVLGGIISALAFGEVNLLGMVLYLGGCVVGGLIFLILVARVKPLELLQVKE